MKILKLLAVVIIVHSFNGVNLQAYTKSDKISAFKIISLESGRIITPNGDGINDTFAVSLENPQERLLTGMIFDINGREIAEMQTSANGKTMFWNGRDRTGNSIASGTYIYQIRDENSVTNGIVIVAI